MYKIFHFDLSFIRFLICVIIVKIMKKESHSQVLSFPSLNKKVLNYSKNNIDITSVHVDENTIGELILQTFVYFKWFTSLLILQPLSIRLQTF